MKESRIAIGSAQFGMNYGIANNNGKVSEYNIKKILSFARLHNIFTIDTAISYGDSEECIGKAGMNGWKIVTKIPKIPSSCQDIHGWISRNINNSLARLNVKNIDAVLLHFPLQLLEKSGSDIWNSLKQIKNSGVINKIGFSLYSPEELDKLYHLFKPDIVQFPYNILDRRIEISGWLKFLSDKGVETHARSVFLQGLLLLNKNNRQKKFSDWKDLWKSWDDLLEKQNISALQACIGFVMSNQCIDKIVLGVDNNIHLEEIIGLKSISCINELKKFNTNDLDLIDPSLWDNSVR